jgi:hypothetical protein
VPDPVAKGWQTLIDFAARDDPKVRDIKIEEGLDESGFINSLELK